MVEGKSLALALLELRPREKARTKSGLTVTLDLEDEAAVCTAVYFFEFGFSLIHFQLGASSRDP